MSSKEMIIDGAGLDDDILTRCIGENLRRWRKQQRISQEDIGRVIGTTFQQVQKYESGINRISTTRLARICAHFNLNIDYFCAGAVDIAINQLKEKHYENAKENA